MLSDISWISVRDRLTASPCWLVLPATFVTDAATCCVACADWLAFSVSCAAKVETSEAVFWICSISVRRLRMVSP